MEKSNWDAILSTKKLLTGEEAKKAKKAMAIFKEDYGCLRLNELSFQNA